MRNEIIYLLSFIFKNFEIETSALVSKITLNMLKKTSKICSAKKKHKDYESICTPNCYHAIFI